jgi:hypothetical protein
VQFLHGDTAAVGVDRLGDRAPHARADVAPDGIPLECVAVDDRVIVARNCMTITTVTANGILLSL